MGSAAVMAVLLHFHGQCKYENERNRLKASHLLLFDLLLQKPRNLMARRCRWVVPRPQLTEYGLHLRQANRERL